MNFKKVKIKNTYSHYDFIYENDWLTPIPDGTYGRIAGFDLPNYSDYHRITNKGKAALFTYSTTLTTRIISIIALIISVLAYFKK